MAHNPVSQNSVIIVFTDKKIKKLMLSMFEVISLNIPKDIECLVHEFAKSGEVNLLYAKQGQLAMVKK